jgi:hypothetical protein
MHIQNNIATKVASFYLPPHHNSNNSNILTHCTIVAIAFVLPKKETTKKQSKKIKNLQLQIQFTKCKSKFH